MADKVTAKNKDSQFEPHPEGQFVGQCVDCIDLGETVVDFPGKPKYLAQKCALIFRTGNVNSAGQYIDLSAEFTVSMSEKANLRKFLESWRGKAYTSEEVEIGVPLDRLEGNWGLLSVAQKKSKKDRLYSYIVSIVSVPKQMRAGLEPFGDYKRAEYWQDRKDEYLKGARTLRMEIGAPVGEPDPVNTEDFSDDGEAEDNSLPF